MSVYEKNKKWYFNFMLFGKRKHGACRGCTNRSEALEYEAEQKNELSLIMRGLKPTSEILKFREIIKDFLEYSKINKKPAGYAADVYHAKVVTDFFGPATKVLEITPKNIENFKQHITEKLKLSNATCNRYLSVISKTFNLADKNYGNIKNPCKYVRKCKENTNKIRYLTREEEKRLFDCLPEYLKPIVVCALTTGLRLSNILNLRWEQIDIQNNYVEIQKQDNKGRKQIKIPLAKKFRTELEKIGIKNEGYVFISPKTGTKFNCIKRSFKTALKNANIENFRFHDLRHTVATRLVANGADLMTVKQYMAHSSITTTQRYAHPTPENMLNATDILNNF